MESGANRNRPRRSCVVESRKMKEEKAKEEFDYYIPLFYNDVVCYCIFIFLLLFPSSENDPSNLAFKRKLDEVMAELYSLCARWQNLVKVKSVYFYPESKPDLKTSIVCFNYNKPKNLFDRDIMERITKEFDAFKDELKNKEFLLRGVCQPKSIDKNSGLVEDFIYAVKTNNIQERVLAYLENKVDPSHIKSFPAVRFSKKLSEDECAICLGAFKANEKLFKMKCGKFLHNNCLKECLKKFNYCPLCKEILS